MIDQKSVANSLDELARQIQPTDPNGFVRLNLLKDAVLSNSHTDAWAYADVHSLIAPESIVERYRSSVRSGVDGFVTLLEVLRNTFIFAPIIVTWYAISQATSSYNTFITRAVQLKQQDLYSLSFLYLWQQRFFGYGNFPDSLTLSSIAWVDVLILLAILFSTFFAYILSNSSTARKTREAQLLSSNLNHAITGAVLYLHSRPKLTAENNLELVARNLDGMMRDISNQIYQLSQQSAARLEKMAEDTTLHMEKISQSTTARFDTMAHDLAEKFMDSTSQTKTQLDTIVQEITKQVEAGKDYLVQLGSLTSGVVKTATEIQSAAHALQSSNTSLVDGINDLVLPVKTLSQQQALLLDTVQRAAGLLNGNATSIKGLVGTQQKMVDDLADTLDTLTLAVEKFASLGTEQSNLVRQNGVFLQQVQDEHSRQAQLANLLSEASSGVKDALAEMRTGAINLRSMAVSMDDMMRFQAAMVSNPGMPVAVDLSHITQNYDRAAQMIVGSGNTLNAAAIAIQKASEQLQDVLDAVPTAPHVGKN